MIAIRCALAALLTAAIAGAMQAGEPIQWSGYPTPAGGYTVIFGDLEDGESTLFQAWCDSPGSPLGFLYVSDREILPGQVATDGGLRGEVSGLEIVVSVDGRRFAYEGRARPEELYGGHEIIWTAAAGDPVVEALHAGSHLQLEFGGQTEEPLSLVGAMEAFSTFISVCRD